MNLKNLNADLTWLSRAQDLSVPGFELPNLSALTAKLPSFKLPTLPGVPSLPGLSALGGLAGLDGASLVGDTSWRSRVVRASFRGVEFLTERHDASGGRRLVVHEYPGAEVPVVEDLGGKAWDWKLTAYFIGPDFDRARNDFLARLVRPGADWLVHPWLGTIWVRAHTWSVSDTVGQEGYSTVTVTFAEGGMLPYVAGADRVDVASSALGKLGDLAASTFGLEAMSAGGMTEFVAAVQGHLGTLSGILSLARLPLTWASQLRHLVAGIKGDLGALFAVPAEYATALHGLANDIGFGADDYDVPAADRPRVVARVVSTALASPSSSASTSSSSGDAGVVSTEPAVRRNLVREAALRSQLLVVAAGQIALTDYAAAEDRDAALVSVVLALDALLPALPDELFQAALTARTALIEALTAQDLRPAQQRDIVRALPAVVLAHRLSVDASVFLARNQVRHPLFVSGRVYG